MRFTGIEKPAVVEREPSPEIQIETGLFELKDVTKEPPKQMEDAGYIDASRGIACAYDGMGAGAAAEYASNAALRETQACTQNESAYPGLSCPITETVKQEVLGQEATRLITYLNQIVWKEKELPVVAQRAAELVRQEHPRIPPTHHRFNELVEECIYSNQTTIAFTKIFQTPDGKTRAMCVNVGDSRTYLRRKGVWTQLTKDQAYSEPLLKAGLIQNELDREQLVQRTDIEHALANTTDAGIKQAFTLLLEIYDAEKETELPLGHFNWVVYGSLGYDETEVHPNVSFTDLEDGDELYTMTDGPYENLSLEHFEQLRLSVVNGDLTEVCKKLCEAAQAADKKPDDNLVAAQRVTIQPTRKTAPAQPIQS